MGFIRRQEEKMAARLIQWHLTQRGAPPLSSDELAQKSAHLVAEAHRVARHRGRNVFSIMKEMVAEIMKR